MEQRQWFRRAWSWLLDFIIYAFRVICKSLTSAWIVAVFIATLLSLLSPVAINNFPEHEKAISYWSNMIPPTLLFIISVGLLVLVVPFWIHKEQEAKTKAAERATKEEQAKREAEHAKQIEQQEVKLKAAERAAEEDRVRRDVEHARQVALLKAQIEENHKGHETATAKQTAVIEEMKQSLEQQRHSDPRRNAIRHEIETRLKLFQSLLSRLEAGDTNAGREVYTLEFQTLTYLGKALPEYTRFEEGCRVDSAVPNEHQIKLTDAGNRCRVRIERLNEVLEILG